MSNQLRTLQRARTFLQQVPLCFIGLSSRRNELDLSFEEDVTYSVQKPAPADVGFYEAMLDVLWEGLRGNHGQILARKCQKSLRLRQ